MSPASLLLQWTANNHRPWPGLHLAAVIGQRIKKPQRRLTHFPWYVMLGTLASGKSTLLQQCGPSSRRDDISRRLSGSTQDCVTWITNGAVVLDVAGHHCRCGDSALPENESWQHFVKRLRSIRGRCKIDGILLTVSVEELLNEVPVQRQQIAYVLRQRVEELQQCFKTVVPCFLLVTKCDRLPGFNDFFAGLSAQQRQQALGVTLPANSPATALTSQFNRLAANLHALLPVRMAKECNTARRQAMSVFPCQFEMLGPRLEELAATLFTAGSSAQLHALNALCFTCADQHGAPVGTQLARIAAGFGLRMASPFSSTDTHASFFTQRIFNDLIFTTTGAVQRRDRNQQKVRFIRKSVVIGVAGVVLAGMTILTSSLLTWRTDIGEMRQLLTQYSAPQQETSGAGGTPGFYAVQHRMSPLQRAARVASGIQDTWLLSLGGADQRIASIAHAAYARALERQWLPALGALILRYMQNDELDYTHRFNALKAWLMLADPRHRDINYLRQWLTSSGLFENDELLAESWSHLIALHGANEHFQLRDTDHNTIRRIRQQLLAVTPQQRLYAQLLEKFRGKYLDLEPLLGTNNDAIFDVRGNQAWVVPAIYTATAYKVLNFASSDIAVAEMSSDSWVLGSQVSTLTELRPAAIMADLQRRYLKDYAAAWNGVFNGISLKSARHATALVDMLQLLADQGTSPLAALLQVTADNARLISSVSDTDHKAGKEMPIAYDLPQVSPPLLQPAITVLPAQHRIADITSALTELHGWLSAIYGASDPGAAALLALQTEGSGVNPAQKTLALARKLPAPVSGWIAGLAQSATALVSSSATTALNQAWNRQVTSYCKAGLEQRYPFLIAADSQASYSDFVDYFRPGGIEDSFVQKNLDAYIDRISWSARPGAAVKISADTLRELQLAQQIRDAFFSRDKSRAGFQFDVRPVRMSARLQRFSIRYGNGHVEYSHGPKMASSLTWPQQGEAMTVTFDTLNNTRETRHFDGTWAFYRLLDDARRSPERGDGSLTVKFNKGPYSVVLSLSTPQRYNPLQRERLTAYRCLDRL